MLTEAVCLRNRSEAGPPRLALTAGSPMGPMGMIQTQPSRTAFEMAPESVLTCSLP